MQSKVKTRLRNAPFMSSDLILLLPCSHHYFLYVVTVPPSMLGNTCSPLQADFEREFLFPLVWRTKESHKWLLLSVLLISREKRGRESFISPWAATHRAHCSYLVLLEILLAWFFDIELKNIRAAGKMGATAPKKDIICYRCMVLVSSLHCFVGFEGHTPKAGGGWNVYIPHTKLFRCLKGFFLNRF